MQSLSHKIFAFATTVILLAACEKEDNVAPLNIEGKWNADEVSSKMQFQNEDPTNSTEDLSSSGIYFNFDSDGTYTTNAILGIDNISAGDGTEYTNEYKIVDGKIQLTFKEADLGIPISLSFTPVIMDNEMKITLTKKALLDDIASMSGKLDVFSEAILQAVVGQILDFEYTITLVKA